MSDLYSFFDAGAFGLRRGAPRISATPCGSYRDVFVVKDASAQIEEEAKCHFQRGGVVLYEAKRAGFFR